MMLSNVPKTRRGNNTGSPVQTATTTDTPPAASASATPIQLRGRFFTAVVLRLSGPPDQDFAADLDKLMCRSPQFFVNAPLVIDVEAATDVDTKEAFQRLARLLRNRKVLPIGVQNATPAQVEAAAHAGLVSLPAGRESPLEDRGRKAQPGPVSPDTTSRVSRLITEPVRSGQQVVAETGDLIVTAPVSAGAELIADGHIHVYGPLRGRALAGVNGDRSARIFCQCLQAELLAIAGLYATHETLETRLIGGRVQAFLKDDALWVEPLK